MHLSTRHNTGACALKWLLITVGVLAMGKPTRAASTILTNSESSALRAAVRQGGRVTLAFDGVVRLTEALTIVTNTVVDATGHLVSLDGGNLVRHFTVTNGVALRLVNLELANGSDIGATGQVNEAGSPGWGGSIYNSGGRIEAIGCRFLNNQVVGGHGGPTTNYLAIPGPPTVGSPGFGGAIYSKNGQLWLTNCLFANNGCAGGEGTTNRDASTVRGGDALGGAVYSTNGQLGFMNVTFSNNIARGGKMVGVRPLTDGGGEAFGGGLADIDGRTSIEACRFLTNQVFGDYAFGNSNGRGQGGAIYRTRGSMTIDKALISMNKATGGPATRRVPESVSAAIGYGGGVYNESGSLEIRNSALTSNDSIGGPGSSNGITADIYGGGGQGGAIYNESEGSLAVINSTLAQNNATSGAGPQGSATGAAVYNRAGGIALLVNATIADNFARPAEGTTDPDPADFGGAIQGTVQLTNTILFSSSSQSIVFGTIIDGGHNLCSDGSADLSLPTSRNSVNPLLGPLADNGGPTPTLALLRGSPAIDAGDDSACPPEDQRGLARPQGWACDIGAFELAPKVTLLKHPDGKLSVEYVFQPGRTNRIMASTNLVDWLLLGTRVTDTNGVFVFEDPDSVQLPRRFYHVPAPVER